MNTKSTLHAISDGNSSHDPQYSQAPLLLSLKYKNCSCAVLPIISSKTLIIGALLNLPGIENISVHHGNTTPARTTSGYS